MPNPKIQPGTQYVDGDTLTYQNLNELVSKAVPLKEFISDQTELISVASDDVVLVVDVSDTTVSGNYPKKIKVSNLLNTGLPITGIDSITAKTDSNINITLDTDKAVNIDENFNVSKDVTIGETLTVAGKTIINNELDVNGYLKVTSTEAMLLPSGTTAQRPATPVVGQFRFNTTTQKAEVYKGTTWEEVGGGPFDATGGNKVIAPDSASATPTTASFTSTNGESVIVTSGGHSVIAGQVVKITTSVNGYSGEFQVISADASTFTYVMPVLAVPNSGSCTYKKSGNFKVHIYTSSGTFVNTGKAGNVEVLVVGGGGGGSSGGDYSGGGGGGAVCYSSYYPVDIGQTISVTVGSGGTANGNGVASVFGTIIAGGGFAGVAGSYSGGGAGGASGNGNSLCPSNAGGSKSPYNGTSNASSGGGGGAGGVGQNGFVGDIVEGGDGGQGRGSNISGIPATYGGGGAAGGRWLGVGVSTATASNGGGNPNANGATNTGGGGGGKPYRGSPGTGGSGIVIVRYPYWS